MNAFLLWQGLGPQWAQGYGYFSRKGTQRTQEKERKRRGRFFTSFGFKPQRAQGYRCFSRKGAQRTQEKELKKRAPLQSTNSRGGGTI